MMKQHFRYLAVLGGVWGACAMVYTVFYLFYLAPLMTQSRTLDTQLLEAKQRHTEAQAATRENVQTKLAHDLDSLQETLHAFVYPQNKLGPLPFLIGDIAKPFSIHNLNITNTPIRASMHNNTGKYTVTKQMDLQFNGSFHQIAGFLNALERTQPVMMVNEFQVSQPRRSDQYPSGSIQLIIIGETPDKI